MTKLNDRQREAVLYIDGPLLVLAGAGSGKTSVITRKMAYLIEKCGIPARHIAAVTFTNKAAREMKERVGALVKGKAAHGLTVSTFHNLGMNILRREYAALNYKSGFSIFDAQDAQALIRDLLIQEHGSDGDQADRIQQRISHWKNEFVLPEQAVAEAEGPADMLCAQAYIRYQKALKAYNALDFDDLILLLPRCDKHGVAAPRVDALGVRARVEERLGEVGLVGRSGPHETGEVVLALEGRRGPCGDRREELVHLRLVRFDPLLADLAQLHVDRVLRFIPRAAAKVVLLGVEVRDTLKRSVVAAHDREGGEQQAAEARHVEL